MKGLLQVEGGDAVLLFVRSISILLGGCWRMVHHIPQGEGGEQGDALVPLLFAVGQHRADTRERLFAIHDDIYMVTMPERVGAVYSVVEEQLRVHARVGIHGGKTRVWNRVGERPQICDVLERIARMENLRAVVSQRQGIKVLGNPLGHDDFVAQHLRTVTRDHHCLHSCKMFNLHGCCSSTLNQTHTTVSPPSVFDHYNWTPAAAHWMKNAMKANPVVLAACLQMTVVGDLHVSGRRRVARQVLRDKR